MAGSDTQKAAPHTDFAASPLESLKEKRVVAGLKKRIEDLSSELEAANLELEDATEHELKGLEVEFAVNEASIQALETSELEESCTHLSEELQKRCVCPNCHLDNLSALGGILQANEPN